MGKLIEADALHPENYALHGSDLNKAYEMIENAPAVDAVPVVRCKKCRWGRKPDEKAGYVDGVTLCYCPEMNDGGICSMWDNDFCSYGEPVEKHVESVDNHG